MEVGNFGATIRVTRAGLGLTQRELAKQAKIGTQAMNFIETGRKVPRRSTVAKIMRAMKRQAVKTAKLAAHVRRMEVERNTGVSIKIAS